MNGTITDPSDWPSDYVSLREIDSHLRCPICKELMRGAIMLQCGHNFCSECIRRHLDKEQACPACRVAASTSQMRRNVALDEIANHFGDCRARLLTAVTSASTKHEASASNTSMEIDDSVRQQKRRRISGRMTPKSSQEPMDLDMNGYHRSSIKKGGDNNDDDDDFVVSSQDLKNSHHERPTLRRSGRTSATSIPATDSIPQSAPSPIKAHTFSSSSEATVAATPPTPTTPTRRLPKHTLVACPVCECAIPEAQTNSHLDKFCFTGKKDPIYTLSYTLLMGHLTEAKAIELYERVGYTTGAVSPAKASSPTSSPTRTQTVVNPFGQSPARSQNQAGNSSLFGGPSRQLVPIAPNPNAIVAKAIPPERKKIPKLTYSVLNDKQLRKKLGELGLAAHGDKQLMQKRHAEYVTIYNANCDSTRPLSDVQLRRNMEIWERTNDQDIAAKEQLKRATEQQRSIQQRELAQKQSTAPQGSASSTADSSGASGSAPTSTSGRPFSRSTSGSNFVANQNNNAEVNVAVAGASAFAHALKYAAEYQELIADVRKRQEQDKVRKQEASNQDEKDATSSATTTSSQSSQSSSQPKASAPAGRSSSQQSNASASQSRHTEQTASQSSTASSQSSVFEDQPSSQSSQHALPLTPSKLRHPHRPVEQT